MPLQPSVIPNAALRVSADRSCLTPKWRPTPPMNVVARGRLMSTEAPGCSPVLETCWRRGIADPFISLHWLGWYDTGEEGLVLPAKSCRNLYRVGGTYCAELAGRLGGLSELAAGALWRLDAASKCRRCPQRVPAPARSTVFRESPASSADAA